jgi:hypothetical protein
MPGQVRWIGRIGHVEPMVSAPANRHDLPLLEPTLEGLSRFDLNAIQLCGALEEVDLGWAVVGDVAVGGAFGSLVFQSAAFDGAGAAAMSTGRVESLDDFTDRGLDRPGESAGGKTPPGR